MSEDIRKKKDWKCDNGKYKEKEKKKMSKIFFFSSIFSQHN